jgi:protein phosphatase
MGTTLTAVLFSGSKIGMVHIGDSRAYLLRQGEFAQITKDDTYVQMLVDEGRISPEEASSHPQRSLLTRALDGRDIDPEYSVRQVLPGDRYLICSDGLSGVVSAETIDESLRGYADPQQCVERLVQLALRGGGPDNITVVIADATDADIVEAAPIVGGAAARDRGNATVADSSTPAARASALQAPPRPATQPEPASDADRDDADERQRHPVRVLVLAVVLFGLLGGGLWLGWRYTQTQYYVGATEAGEIAIFRGVPGQVAGFDLSSENELSTARLEDLTTVAQDRVLQGIKAKSRPEAQRTLQELTSDNPANVNLKPICSPTPTPSAGTPAPGVTGTPPAATAPATGASGAVRPSGTVPGVARTVVPGAIVAPVGTPTVPSVQAVPPSETPPPVVDPVGCRQAD